MNSITRLILRRVASGNVKLTPRLFEVLKELDPVQPLVAAAKHSGNVANRSAEQFRRATPASEKRLTFINPLPGRWIRRTECAAGIALLLAANLAQAAPDPGRMEVANHAFAQGKYSEAAHGYESIIAQQGYSAPVLFNLANAEQRGGNLGQAILNYERAALLSPNDPDITANLNFARKQAGVELEPRSAMIKAAHTLSLNTWFGLASIALFLFAGSWPLKLLRPQARRSLNLGSVVAAFAFTVAVGAIGLRHSDLPRAVVIVPEAVAGVSPVTTAQPVFKLRAGEVVTWQQTHGPFTRIRNHAGHEGWIQTSDIARVIIPASAIFPGS